MKFLASDLTVTECWRGRSLYE